MSSTKKLTFLLALAVLTSCGGGPANSGCTVTLTATGDVQTAANAAFVGAGDGDVICFAPGSYSFTEPLEARSLSGLTVRGTGAARGDVTLDFFEQAAGAKGLSFTAVDGLLVENLTVIDASGDDLYVQGSDGVTLRNVSAGWVRRPMSARGRYALYPVESTDVVIENSEAFGSSDAGIYVGQATNCVVRNSTAHDNVAGIEIENSFNCEVYGNTAEDNTGGILVFELPGLDLRGSGTSVHYNVVRDNNTPNFADPAGIIGFLPDGTGMMVLAANSVEIFDNTITGNDTTAILVISYQTAILAGAPDPMDPAYDMFSEDIYLHDNTCTGNGARPDVDVAGLARLVDGMQIAIVWDGFIQEGADASTLCIQNSGEFRNIDAPGSFAMPSDDLAPHDCMEPVRPPVSL